eukprot:scaffold735_cov116-Cylindrotheca_fusiformis.AAC.29
MTTTNDANSCEPSEPSEEDLATFAAMEEGLETNIQSSNDEDDDVTMDIHPNPPMMITHLSIMREDSPLLGGAPKIKKKNKTKRNWQKTSGWMVRSFWKRYTASMDRYPLWTNCWTSGLLTLLGDLVAQLISYSAVSEISLYESCKFFLLGLCVQAPMSHYYYLALDDAFPPTPNPWTISTLIKLVIDQLLFAPTFLLVVFVFLDILDGRYHYGEMEHHLQQDFGSTLVANWKLWLPATIINLAFVSPEYRVLYSNIIFFVWTVVLAMLVVVPTAPTAATTATTAT